MRPWTTLESKYLLRRKWMNLREERVQLPHGAVIDEFHVLEYPDWACVVCLDRSGQAVMVEQYRHAIGQVSLELPAGVVNEGEAPLAAAQRELLEETGYVADTWTYLGRVSPEPSRHTNYAHMYVALGAHRVDEQQLDDSEDIAVRLCDPVDVLRMADAGEIVHGMHLMAILWAAQRGYLEPRV